MDWGEEHIAAWNERDPDRLVARFAPTGRYVDMAYGITFDGHDALRQMRAMTANAFPDHEWAYRGGFRDAERFVVEWTFTATAGGERHAVDGVSVGTFDDQGRIVETREYFNAGAFPAPDTTNERRMVDQ